MLSFATIAVLAVSSTLAHPHFGGYPQFHSEDRPLDQQPTVNVFKIYAPRLFYMPAYKSSDNYKKNKQMISPGENAIENMLRTEMFPDGLFDESANSIFDYDEDFVPQPSNIVSRKLPMYAPLPGPPMMPGPFSPPMHLDNFNPMMGNNHREMMDDMPDYYDMHDENCEHHGMFQSFNTHMDDDYPDYPSIQFIDPLFMNNVPRQGPIDRPAFPIITQNSAGPMTTFFKKFVSEPSQEEKIQTQVLTTMSFGLPEIIEEEKKAIAEQIEIMKKNENDGGDYTTIIIAEEIPSDQEESSIEAEIERNFIKTILPDNSEVTTEVEGTDTDDTEEMESEEQDGPVEEVEVNIVKTMLPDDSYLISEAGGDNEKLQDEVISLIQNGEAISADSSNGNVFISRYLQTPEE